MLIQALFASFAAVAVLAALMTVLSRNPVHSALSLVLAFFATAASWMLIEAEFLAITLILVYVGAVMVLFLFVVMMINLELPELVKSMRYHYPLAFVVAALFIAALGFVFVQPSATFGQTLVHQPEGYSNATVLGTELFTHYLLPFELAGIILMLAIIAAIGLTHRASPRSKRQFASEQVKATKQERLTIVKMDAEGGYK